MLRTKGGPTKKFLFVTGLVTCTLLLAEGGLRISGKSVPPPYPPRLRHPELQAYEPYGYRLFPSRRTAITYPLNPPRTIAVMSNRDGFRANRELDESDARPRILFLGGSIVIGDGVEESERFTNILETLEPSRRMDNLGMTSYSPDLMLRSLEVVGLKLKPTLVIFCMYTDEFRRVRPEFDGAGFLIPRYKLESGHLVSTPYPTPHIWDRLRISVAARNFLWNHTNRQWDLNQAILDRFEQLADQRPFQKAIIFLPGEADTRADQERRSWLGQYASRHGTPFLDLSDAIHQMGKQAFVMDNPHFSPAAHQVVARELDRFLSERHLPAP